MEPIDRTEKVIRFGFGAFTGLCLALSVALGLCPDFTPLGLAMLVGGVALTCGVAARYLGDEFWHKLAFWLWWW